MTFQGSSTDRLVDKILEFCSQQRVELILVDGTGVGGGVVDLLRRHNMNVEDVQFAGKVERTDKDKFANKRAEMWGTMKEALKYLAIPPSSDLRDQLISPEYDYNLRGEIQLEKKSEMKKRGLASPDIADALALTYARTVFPRADLDWINSSQGNVVSDYSPIEEFEREQREQKPRMAPRYVAPGWPRLKDDEH
jgi:hypothetical protein